MPLAQDARAWTPYCGQAPAPGSLWTSWNLDPLVLAALAALTATLWITCPNRRPAGLAAVAILAVAFVSPLCALSSALFAARTVHHILLVSIVAPLLAWTLPPPKTSRGLAATTLVLAVVFWAWHTPGAYGWALSNDAVYWLMQASVLIAAILGWRGVRVAPAPAAVAALLVTMVQMGLLGALLIFMPRAIYAPHALTTAAWGLSPLDDQQLAGLIMAAPAAALYMVAALTILGRHLRASGPPPAVPAT